MAYSRITNSLTRNAVQYDALGNVVLPNGLRVLGLQTAGFVKADDKGIFYIDTSGGGSVGQTTESLTFNNSGSGAASGATFNGSTAVTISYNSIGAQASSSNLTALSGLTYSAPGGYVKMTGVNTFVLDSISPTTPTLQNVLLSGNSSNQSIQLANTSYSKVVEISLDTNGNIIFNAGPNQNFHFSGDVVAFSNLTPPASTWWDNMPYATDTTVGGIKVGSGLTITNGVLSISGGAIGTTTYTLTFNNSGSGSASGSTFNGSNAITVSYNTIGAAPLTHTHAISDVSGLQSALDQRSVIIGSPAANYVTYWTGSTTITGEAAFYWNPTTKRLGIKDSTGTKEFTIEVDTNGNIIFTAGVNQNFHFSGDVIAFSNLTPPSSTWWDNLPIATASTLGGIKVGTGLSINGSGVLSVTTGSGVGSVTSIATTAPLTGGTITSTGTIGITQATTSTDGYLSSTDWNSFNNKQAGHIIWNNAGTSVTQETVLQFKRLDVTAETGKTVVTRPSDTYVSVSPPTSPFSGDTWISSETLKAYVYYDGFWVEDGSVAINGVTQAYVDAKFATRYARRSDFTGTYAYCGTAAFGSAEGSAVWYITRIPINANGTTGTVQRAPNNSIWTNRASLTYT